MMSFPGNVSSYGVTGALVKSKYSSPGIDGTVLYCSSEDCSIEQARVQDVGG